MASLFNYDEDARLRREALNGLDVPDAMIDAAGLLPVAAEPPKHWLEEARERDGSAKFFGKMLLGGFTGTMPFIFPEGIGGNARYKAELAQYSDSRRELEKQQQMAQDIAALSDGVEGPEDAQARARLLAADGLGTIDKVNFTLGEETKLKPAWETKYDNGVLVRFDKNNPGNAEVVKGPDGNPITEKADGDIRKTSGWFRRAVPALQNMHKLEDRGVALPREALLLTQQAQDADGFFDMQLYNKLLNDLSLSQDQRQYLRNAQDLAMIQLRKESGAAIGVQEMFNELGQNVMLTDMSDEGYEYQRGTRLNKYRQLSAEMPKTVTDKFASEGLYSTLDRLEANLGRAGQAAVTPEGKAWNGSRYDFTGVSGELMDAIYEELPEGFPYVGPDGKVRRKGSQ